MDFLVCIDCQNDFITGSLGSTAAAEVLPHIVDKVENWNDTVICTYDTHDKEYLSTFEGQHLPIEHCIIDEHNDGWVMPSDLYDATIRKRASEIYKHSFGTFTLPERIRNILRGPLNSITLIGYCTDICVLVNAMILRTAFPDTRIIVDASCCAGTTEEAHKAALLVMKNCQIEIINE